MVSQGLLRRGVGPFRLFSWAACSGARNTGRPGVVPMNYSAAFTFVPPVPLAAPLAIPDTERTSTLPPSAGFAFDLSLATFVISTVPSIGPRFLVSKHGRT